MAQQDTPYSPPGQGDDDTAAARHAEPTSPQDPGSRPDAAADDDVIAHAAEASEDAPWCIGAASLG
jgi:hypothetical protein